MKRINLIPPERRKITFNKRLLKRYILKPGLSGAIVLVVVMFVSAPFWQMISAGVYKTKIAAAKKTIQNAQVLLVENEARKGELKAEKDAVSKQNQRLKGKLVFLQDAKNVGIKWSPILFRLGDIIPEKAWMKKILVDEDIITFSGTTSDNSIISQFMLELEGVEYFQDTTFNYTQKEKYAGEGMTNFEVTTHLAGGFPNYGKSGAASHDEGKAAEEHTR